MKYLLILLVVTISSCGERNLCLTAYEFNELLTDHCHDKCNEESGIPHVPKDIKETAEY